MYTGCWSIWAEPPYQQAGPLTYGHIAEKTEGKRDRAKQDRDDLDDPDREKHAKERIVNGCGDFFFIGLVAENILQHQRRTRVTHDKIEPAHESHHRERGGSVHVG